MTAVTTFYLNKALNDAVCKTKPDSNEVRLLLEERADPNSWDGFESILHTAAKLGRVEAVRLLLEFKADVGKVAYVRTTPLHNACWAGDLVLARLLLEHKADICAAESGVTPLTEAIRFNEEEQSLPLTRLLIDAKSDVNHVLRDGIFPTPLIAACKVRKYATAALLLDAKADPNLANEAGQTPLSVALASKHNGPIVNLLTQASKDFDKKSN